jgi:hypothetical protein
MSSNGIPSPTLTLLGMADLPTDQVRFYQSSEVIPEGPAHLNHRVQLAIPWPRLKSTLVKHSSDHVEIAAQR